MTARTPARRYLLVVQGASGYPPTGAPLEAAPTDGPPQPMLHTAVLECDYLALEGEVERLEREVARLRERANG